MASDSLTLKLVLDAGVAVMAMVGGGLKELAPPEMPRLWVILGTVAASAAFLSAKLLLNLNGVQLNRDTWFTAAIVAVFVSVCCGIFYLLTRFARTLRYGGQLLLVGTESEYHASVAADPQNAGKTREALLADAAGEVGDVWTPQALRKSRRLLGIRYTVFISLLAFGLYLGIEAWHAPASPRPGVPPPTFAQMIAGLRDVHFALNSTELGRDSVELLQSDAGILRDVFRQFPAAAVILEGQGDDRGSDRYNFDLGYRRAEAVRAILIANQVDPSRVTLSSVGKKPSTCQPNDEGCRDGSRKVHLRAVLN